MSDNRSPVRERKNRDAWKPSDTRSVRGLHSSNSAESVQPQLKTLGREQEQADQILLLTVLSLVTWEVFWWRKASWKASHRQKKHYFDRVLWKEYSHLFKPYKKIRLLEFTLNKGKPWFVYTKNAFYGSNLNQSQMEASWKVKWGDLLPAASRVMDPTKGRESSQGAYRAGLPTEHFEEAPD